MPEVSAVTPAGKMTATMAAKVTTTVAAAKVAATVAASVTTATMAAPAVAAATCLGRHIGCDHHHTGGAGCREAINSRQGPEGQ